MRFMRRIEECTRSDQITNEDRNCLFITLYNKKNEYHQGWKQSTERIHD